MDNLLKMLIMMAMMEVAMDNEEATDNDEHDCSTCEAADSCPIRDTKMQFERDKAFDDALKNM